MGSLDLLAKLGEFSLVDLVGLEQVTHQCRCATAEQPLFEVADHRPHHRVLADGRRIDEASSLAAMGDDALGFHLLEHGGDRGGGEPVRWFQRAMDFGDGALAFDPQHPHDGELKLAQMFGNHDYRVSTTMVVDLQARIRGPRGPGTMVSEYGGEAPSTQGVRGLILKWLAVVGLLGIGVATANALREPPHIPPPHASRADLPPLPDSGDNGWSRIKRLPPDLALNTSELSKVMAPVLDESAPWNERWQQLSEHEPLIQRLLSTPEHRIALRAWHRAAVAAQFVDGCRNRPRYDCPYFRYFEVHELALAEVIAYAFDGAWVDANRRLAQVLTLDRGLLSTCRNSASATVASTTTAHALGLAELLLRRQPAHDPHLDREALQGAVDALAADALLQGVGVRQRVLIGDYLRQRLVLEAVEAEGVSVLVGDAWWPPAAMYDPEHATTLVDTVYRELHARYDTPGVRRQWDQDATPVGCNQVDRIIDRIGCTHFDPQQTRASHELTMSQIDDNLQLASRWLRRTHEP